MRGARLRPAPGVAPLPGKGPLLVNARHPLPEGYSPGPLVAVAGSEHLMQREAAAAMECLLDACGGRESIRAVSGWRSRGEQAALYRETAAERGEAFACRYVALPGCSEHETGLALDVGLLGADDDPVCPGFPNRGAAARFRQLAPLYGFVERYPEDKCALTGIGFEPWHFRYVGRPHAGRMAACGWVLEEYAALLEKGVAVWR